MTTDRDRLRSLLREHSLIFGDFTLASGRKSRFYFDSKRTTLLPEGAYLTAREVLRLVRQNGVVADAIGGLTLGADPIVCPVAALSHLEGPPLRAFIVRKEAKDHGTARKIEGNLDPGSRVIIVDDVVTTADSTLQAIAAAVDGGHDVVAVICLVDREEGGSARLASWPFYPVFRRSELFDPAEIGGLLTERPEQGPLRAVEGRMIKRLRRFVAAACVAACIAPLDGLAAVAAEPRGQIAGIVTAPAGLPASDWDVLLVSRAGDLVASVATSSSGRYEFNDVAPGQYRLGVQDVAGNLAPVAGPGAEIAAGSKVRQDIRLVASAGPRLAPAAYGARANSWWDRQTRNQKIFTIVGIVVGTAAVWAIYDAVTDDDETPASPY